jgi:hypothetical protein
MFVYPLGLLVFLLAALVFYVRSFGWIGGKPSSEAKFVGGIFAALFLASFLGTLISMKLACPRLSVDGWPNTQCLYGSMRDFIHSVLKIFA